MLETNIVFVVAVVANAFLVSLFVVSAIEALRVRRTHVDRIPTRLPSILLRKSPR
jgi:hypothetical protein